MSSLAVSGRGVTENLGSLSRKALDRVGNFSERSELICGHFLKYDFKKPYEYAIVMGVMDYIENPKAFLTKLSKTVSVKAVLSFPIAESIWILQRKVRYKLRGCPLYFYRRGQLEELMEYSGFKSYSIERIARDYFVVAEG